MVKAGIILFSMCVVGYSVGRYEAMRRHQNRIKTMEMDILDIILTLRIVLMDLEMMKQPKEWREEKTQEKMRIHKEKQDDEKKITWGDIS